MKNEIVCAQSFEHGEAFETTIPRNVQLKFSRYPMQELCDYKK